jgi:CubicO group peptidase (beta-lactamase class C family)
MARIVRFVWLSIFGSAAAGAQPTSVKPLVPAPRGAESLAPAPVASPGTVRGLRDRAELAAFLDGVMAANLRDVHVAGATVAVVKDGALFFAKGYGYADVARRAPVDAERTLFRIGSTSKLFTWTAVMQLVEQGKLDLDADVNRYLDFAIPATYPQPITLRHVMTHTPGFEEDGRDLFTEDSAKMIPLGRWLATHVPGRVRPPGTYASYSNYATALAGYIVERVSNMPFDDYVERHILEPLGMSQTTTRQPLPDRFRPDMSTGYQWGAGRFAGKPFEIVNGAAPAGSMSASATDMAKFMIAHLNNGVLGGQRILAESTAVRMHARAFGHDPRLPGFALGFYEKSSHGLRIIGHGGDTRWFHTDLALLPDQGIGVLVSYNTNTGGELSFGPFLTEFLDHYYPTPAPAAIAGDPRDAQRVAGQYEFNRRSYTTFQKAFGLAGAIRVSAADSGRLLLHSPLGDRRLVPAGPLLYREELGDNLVSFKADGAGRITHGFLGLAPMMAMERVPWWSAPPLHWVLLGLGVVVFLGTMVAALRRSIRRRLGHARPEDVLPGRWMLVALGLLNVAFLLTAAAVLGTSGGLLENPLTGLKVALALPVLGALLAVGGAVMAVQHWRTGVGTTGARLRYSAVVLTALLFAWSLGHWNLLGWRM